MTTPADHWDISAADVYDGHSETVPVRPQLRLVTQVDWARGELYRLFVTYAPLPALDPSAPLATGREPSDVYGAVFQAAGCSFGDSERRAIALTRAIDQVLEEMYRALGPGAELQRVVPQCREDLVQAARAEILEYTHETGAAADWVEATRTESDWLRTHPAGHAS